MKIAVICSDFKRSNINKLPWKYIHKISTCLDKDNQIVVITDTPENDINELKVLNTKKLFNPLRGETKELLDLLDQEQPDKCIMLLGLTSFLRKEFKIKQPTFGIFTSPIYNLKELISNIGIFNLFKYRKYTFIHVVNSLIPDYLVKKYSGSFEKIVFLSNYSCQKLVDKGFPKEKSVIIPVGVDEHFKEDTDIEELKKFQRNINPENIPLIMYFTSPLTLRGTDTLIKAFGDIRKEKKSKLIFLSRVDHPELQKEEKILRQLAIKNNISDSVEIISDYLSQDVLKNYLSAADLICIPFKIVISDIPVSILEAMSIGKPVISTKVACLPELLPNGILVKANNPKNLADSLSRLVNDRNLSNNLGMNNKFLMEKYPSWDQIASNFKRII